MIADDLYKPKSGLDRNPRPALCVSFLHHLVDHAADSIRRFPLHPLGGVGVGVQGEACAVVAQRVGEGFHIYAVLQGQRREGMT